MTTTDMLQPLARELPRGVAWLRTLPWPAAAALVALGLLGLLLGARHRRAVAAVGGFAAGALAGFTLALPALRSAHVTIGPPTALLLCGVGISVLSFLLPWVFPFTLGAAVGAPLGAKLPVTVPGLGPALGAVAVGGVAVIGARLVAASAAGLLGAAMLVCGLIAIGDALPGVRLIAAHPMVALGIVLVLGVAGAAAQLESAWGTAGGRASKKSRKPELQPRAAREE